MNNLTLRILTGITGAALVIGAILFSELTFLLLLMLIAVLGLLEFYRLVGPPAGPPAPEGGNLQTPEGGSRRIIPDKVLGIAMGVLVFLPVLLNIQFGIGFNSLVLLIVLPYVVFIKELYSRSPQPFLNVAMTFLGLVYIVAPLFMLYMLSYVREAETYQPKIILGYLFLLWASDSGAYFAGRSLGRHKLFERHSPKKTWEGSVGGTILALVVAFILSRTWTVLPLVDWIVMAVIIVVAGTLGDLVESMFKRSIQIKDSGQLLPGHGGILDRFDGLFISVPFVFFYFLIK